MELRRYWIIVRKWYWLMLLGLVLSAATSYVVSSSLTPIYESTVTLQVNQIQDSVGIAGYNDLLASTQLTKTYAELIRQRPVLDPVIYELGLNQVYEAVARQVSVRGIRDTQLIQVSVKRPDPQQAADIANKIGEVFVRQMTEAQGGQISVTREGVRQQIAAVEGEMSNISKEMEGVRAAGGTSAESRAIEQARLQSMMTQYQLVYSQLVKSDQDLALAESKAVGGLRIAVPAVPSRNSVEPKVLYNTLVAAVIGLIVAIGFALLLEYLDDTIKTAEGLEQATSLPTLGIVGIIPPDAGAVQPKKSPEEARKGPASTGDKSKSNGHNPFLVAADLRSHFGESYRTLRSNIQFATLNQPCQTLAVTSAGPNEGKTLTLSNLAITLAQAGKRVLVVDSDLRRPYLHRMFGLSNREGLTNLLVAENQSSIQRFLQDTPYPNLRLLASGPLPPNPTELLSSPQMAKVVESLKQEADVLLFDTPPTFGMADASIVGTLTHGTLLVVESGKNRNEAIVRLKDMMDRAGVRLVGTVLNRFRADANAYYYRHYYRYYHSHYGYSAKEVGSTKS